MTNTETTPSAKSSCCQKCKKKPLVIEAFQWMIDEAPDWWKELKDVQVDVSTGTAYIPTLEGTMAAGPRWWIIRGVKGEIYPCKPDIFEATYEPIEAPIQSAPDEGKMVQKCGEGHRYLANSHEYPCPWCELGKYERLFSDLQECHVYRTISGGCGIDLREGEHSGDCFYGDTLAEAVIKMRASLQSRIKAAEAERDSYRGALEKIASSDYAERCSWADKVTEETGYPHEADDFYCQTANQALSNQYPSSK